LLPSLALNEIAVVQAMDRRVAAVFYLDVKYASAKGTVAVDDTMIGAKSGHSIGKSGRRYAMARVVDELLADGDGQVVAKTLVYNDKLINLENVKIETVDNIGTINEVRTLIGSSDADGSISGDGIDSSATHTISTAGVVNVTIDRVGSGDLGTDIAVYITYDYQYDLIQDADGNNMGVPEVDVAVTESLMEAIDFPLRAKYSIGAQIDLMKAHGIDLESELVKYLGSEVDEFGLKSLAIAA
jgi:hypothetical protein